jgi:hypothetical protein
VASPDIRPAQIPPGQLLTHYGDLASGVLRPEDVRIEALTFRAVIDQLGLVVQSTPKITVVSRYNFSFRAVYGTIVTPVLADAAPGLVRFNIREQGRNWDIFKQPVSFGAVLENEYHWDGTYICVPGTDLEVNWSVDAALWNTLVGASRIVEISLIGDYVACGPTQR